MLEEVLARQVLSKEQKMIWILEEGIGRFSKRCRVSYCGGIARCHEREVDTKRGGSRQLLC